MRRWVVVLVGLCGCGRFGFDDAASTTIDGGGDSGGSGSASLTYPVDHIAAVVNTTSIDVAPTGVVAGMQLTVSPALPSGLTLDASTGRISGIATQASEQTFTITATRGTATATATIDLLALPGSEVPVSGDALRAAVNAAATGGGKRLVLLAPGTYNITTPIIPSGGDVVVAGAGAGTTIIRPGTLHANYAAFQLGNPGALHLRDLTIADFGGTNGGALVLDAGAFDADRCEFTNNWSPGSGGVAYISAIDATFRRCVFTDNRSLGGNGGGWGGVIDGEGTNTNIYVRESYATRNRTAWGSFSHITTGTTLTLENSTLYDNTSTTAGTLATPGGTYTIINSTIVGNTNTNTTPDSAGIYLYSVPCHYTVANSIIANNRDVNGAERDCNRRDLGTSLTSKGGNIFGDSAWNCAQYFTLPGDKLSTDPMLAVSTPGAYGGATPTLTLATGSPARGNASMMCPTLDQRGLPRTTPCDSGAVEMP